MENNKIHLWDKLIMGANRNHYFINTYTNDSNQVILKVLSRSDLYFCIYFVISYFIGIYGIILIFSEKFVGVPFFGLGISAFLFSFILKMKRKNGLNYFLKILKME